MDLYPEKLYQMHQAIESIGDGTLSHSDALDVVAELGPYEELEAKADEILKEFVDNIEDKEKYLEELKKRTSDEAKVLYLLRCFIASHPKSHEDQVPDGVAVLPHKEHALAYEYKRDEDDPYALAKQFMDTELAKHKVKPRAVDLLPEDLNDKFRDVLEDLDCSVESRSEAWDELDSRSKESSIEDRILGRICYLLTNAECRGPGIPMLAMHTVLSDKNNEIAKYGGQDDDTDREG